jgi:DNA-binding MarR family transcriptional regulator
MKSMGTSHESPAPLPPALESSTAYLLSRAVRHAARLAQQEFGGESLRFTHFVTARWIEHVGPCSQIGLAGAMGADASDLVTVLRALDEAGMIRRTPDLADKRRNLLHLTAQGHTWLKQRHEQAMAYESTLCAHLGDGGDALRQQLRQLVRA